MEEDACFKLITQVEKFRILNIWELSFDYSLPKETHGKSTEDFFSFVFFSCVSVFVVVSYKLQITSRYQ